MENHHYFEDKMSKGFSSLYTGKLIIMVASGLLGLFLPIFLYKILAGNFQLVVLYYIAGYLGYAFTLLLFPKFLNKFGFRNSLRASIFLGALFYVIFFFVNSGNAIKLLPFSIIIGIVYKFLYWIPYHVDFAKFTKRHDRGKDISLIIITRDIIGTLMPLLAGLIVTKFDFNVLFLMAIVIYFLAGIPYITIPHTREKFSWTRKQTFKNLVSKERRGPVLAFIGQGAETMISLVVWPIFLLNILNSNLLDVGVVSTLIIGVTVILQLVVGKFIDKSPEKEGEAMEFGSIFYAIGWILKIFVTTAFHIFAIGAYHNIMKIFTKTPFNALTYELAADQGHYVDEFSVLYEMSINIGRTIAGVIILVMSFYLPIQWTFIIAALSSVMLNMLWLKSYNIQPHEVARIRQSH